MVKTSLEQITVNESEFNLAMGKVKKDLIKEMESLQSSYKHVVDTENGIEYLKDNGFRITYFFDKNSQQYFYKFEKKIVGFKP